MPDEHRRRSRHQGPRERPVQGHRPGPADRRGGQAAADARGRAARALPLRALAHQALLRPLAPHGARQHGRRARRASGPARGRAVPARAGVRGAVPLRRRRRGPAGAATTAARATRPGSTGRRARRARGRRGGRLRLGDGRDQRRAVDRSAPGDVLVGPSDGYYTVRTLARAPGPRGIEVRLVASDDDAVRAALPGARLLWLESPTNPLLDVVDVEALTRAAHEAGALVAVDNTLATPLRQRPLELGADFSVASAAKQLTGHSDLMLGHVAVRDPRTRRAARLAHDDRRDPGPVRDLARAPLDRDARAARRAPGAQRRRARGLLGARDDVPRSAGRESAASSPSTSRTRAARGLSWRLPDRRRGDELRRRPLERRAPGALGRRRHLPGLIRLSVGCEDADDLLADVAQALDAAG